MTNPVAPTLETVGGSHAVITSTTLATATVTKWGDVPYIVHFGDGQTLKVGLEQVK